MKRGFAAACPEARQQTRRSCLPTFSGGEAMVGNRGVGAARRHGQLAAGPPDRGAAAEWEARASGGSMPLPPLTREARLSPIDPIDSSLANGQTTEVPPRPGGQGTKAKPVQVRRCPATVTGRITPQPLSPGGARGAGLFPEARTTASVTLRRNLAEWVRQLGVRNPDRAALGRFRPTLTLHRPPCSIRAQARHTSSLPLRAARKE
jgi:hypothetical protein